ncbi:MAG: dUTP diphosphatase [PVC group bacterium]
MKIKYLFKIQNIIDNEIRRICQSDGEALDRNHLVKTQILALEVKTAELANLTKCYKYPAVAKKFEKKKLLIRYIDCFKFLLSIGNDNEFNIVNFNLKDIPECTEENLVDVFLRIFDRITELKKNLFAGNYMPSIIAYMEIFKEFILIGYMLGITFEEVFEYYDTLYKGMVQTAEPPRT